MDLFDSLKEQQTPLSLSDFIENYDFEGSVVLLEGKRNVLKIDQPKLKALGALLAQKTRFMKFRSGNSEGADDFFSEGVAAVNIERLEVIVPYTGHRKKNNRAYDTFSLDDIHLAGESDIIYYSKNNKKTEKLIDQFVAGEKNKFTIKAAYIIRDTIKVLGSEKIRPASFGVFYDDLKSPIQGGTGHTIDVCIKNKIPTVNQTTWFNWL
jgi:hypothetical protein